MTRLAAAGAPRGLRGLHLRLRRWRRRGEPAAPARCRWTNFRAHDYGLIPVERYFELKGKRQLDYISSQGCNFRCAFCSDPFVYGRKWVGPGPERMAMRLQGAVAALPLRRREFPGRDLLHPPRAACRRSPSSCSSRACTSPGRPRCAPTRACACPRSCGARASSRACGGCWSGSSPGRTRCCKRIRKDITHRAGVRDRRTHARATASPALSLHRRLPGRERRERPGHARLAPSACARMSPDFQTPIFYFKPYPGSEHRHRGGRTRVPPAGHPRRVVAVRLRGGTARAVGVAPRSSSSSSASSSSRSSPGSDARRLARCCSAWRATAAAGTSTAGRSRCCFTRWLLPRGAPLVSGPRPCCSSIRRITPAAQCALSAGRAEPRRGARGPVRHDASSTATSSATSSRAAVRACAGRVARPSGVTVMGGPQLPTAIAVPGRCAPAFPRVPIVWGGASRPTAPTPP